MRSCDDPAVCCFTVPAPFPMLLPSRPSSRSRKAHPLRCINKCCFICTFVTLNSARHTTCKCKVWRCGGAQRRVLTSEASQAVRSIELLSSHLHVPSGGVPGCAGGRLQSGALQRRLAMDLANKVAAMAKRTLPVSGVFDEVCCAITQRAHSIGLGGARASLYSHVQPPPCCCITPVKRVACRRCRLCHACSRFFGLPLCSSSVALVSPSQKARRTRLWASWLS